MTSRIALMRETARTRLSHVDGIPVSVTSRNTNGVLQAIAGLSLAAERRDSRRCHCRTIRVIPLLITSNLRFSHTRP